MPRSHEIDSKNLGAATREAYVPCPVENSSFPTVVFDVVSPGARPSTLYVFGDFLKLGVCEMAEVHEGCEMNRSSVLLRLLNHFWLGFELLVVTSLVDVFNFPHSLST